MDPLAPADELRCSSCGAIEPYDPFRHRCARCHEALEIEAPGAADSLLDPPWRTGAARQYGVVGGLWRYRAALPRFDPREVATRVTLGEGGTPLVAAPDLGRELGCEDLWLKDESRNPTGSFKDRGSAVAVAVLTTLGLGSIGTVSTGNMARSVGAYAARARMKATTWVSAATPAEKLAAIAVHGVRLLRIDAPYGDIYEASFEWGAKHQVAFVNSDAALRVEGQKTVAYEIAEQLGEATPGGRPRPADWLIVPTSSGGNLSAIAKGFEEAQAWGWIDASPRLVAVQASGCAPIASAWKAGEAVPLRVGPPDTIAGAISNPSPPSGARALRAIRASGGVAVKVTDDEIRAAQQRLAACTGRFVQPASAAALAALAALRDSGTITSSDRVVLLLTGAGTNAPVPSVQIPAPIALAELPVGI